MRLYDFIKAVHVIFVISWMAGMLYLPRLFVYHSGAGLGSDASEMLKVMERKLLRYIINPAMLLTLALGGWMIALMGVDSFRVQGWLHVKIGLVVLMVAFHGMLARWRKQFERDERPRSARFFRIANEVPALLMVLIVLLAVIKPF